MLATHAPAAKVSCLADYVVRGDVGEGPPKGGVRQADFECCRNVSLGVVDRRRMDQLAVLALQVLWPARWAGPAGT
jgi:hypothetical protein